MESEEIAQLRAYAEPFPEHWILTIKRSELLALIELAERYVDLLD